MMLSRLDGGSGVYSRPRDTLNFFGVCGNTWQGSHSAPPPPGKSQTFPMCHAFTHLWFIASFTDKEAKAQRCSAPCLRSHSCDRWRWGSSTKCPVLPCVPFLCWVLGLSWWDISPAPITPLSGSISLSPCLTWRMG